MKISIITLFPDMFNNFFSTSIIARAISTEKVTINLINIRDFAYDNYKTVDDRPYGGGAGMVMKVEPVHHAIQSITSPSVQARRVIATSAKGVRFDQVLAQQYAQLDELIIVCGHYEGFDERILHYVDEEVSIGDFILTGGELPAALISDAVIRLLPNVLKKEEATQQESFFEVELETLINICGATTLLKRLQTKGVHTVQLLEYPHYTRPSIYNDLSVPEILLGGNHEAITRWRIQQAYSQTCKKRPDLLTKALDNVKNESAPQ